MGPVKECLGRAMVNILAMLCINAKWCIFICECRYVNISCILACIYVISWFQNDTIINIYHINTQPTWVCITYPYAIKGMSIIKFISDAGWKQWWHWQWLFLTNTVPCYQRYRAIHVISINQWDVLYMRGWTGPSWVRVMACYLN